MVIKTKLESERYIEMITSYITKKQKEELEKIAKEDGLSVSSFIRQIIVSKIKNGV